MKLDKVEAGGPPFGLSWRSKRLDVKRGYRTFPFFLGIERGSRPFILSFSVCCNFLQLGLLNELLAQNGEKLDETQNNAIEFNSVLKESVSITR